MTTRILGYLTVLVALAGARTADAQEPARRADDFVDRIGVATHWGYPDTPYGYAYERVRALLADAGIRHVRDGFHPRLPELYTAHGIRATVLFNPGNTAQVVRTVRENRPLIAMVEGPNEVDLFLQSAQYRGQGFPEGPRRWMEDLHAALKGDPATKGVPLIAPSTARADSNARLAPLDDFDYTVMHSYAGGQMPSRSLISDINNNVTNAWRILGPGRALKPIVVTESGYHTALGSSVVVGGAQPGVSEKAQAKYLLRHFAEYFHAGIVRTFSYEFLDEFPDYDTNERQATNAEACFGIVKHDLTPKPAYHALKSLVALLREARWDSGAKRWRLPVPGFRPGTLTFRLAGAPPDVHHTLLQKAGGDFYLLLWREVPSFDLTKREDIANPEATVTLTLPAPAAFVVYRPGASAEPVMRADRPARTLALTVPDEVVVVRIQPQRRPAAGPAPAAPHGLRAASTANSATLSWQPPAGRRPAGYFIWRMGAFAGRTAGTVFRDAGLLPGADYAYSVAAYDTSGRVSPPVTVVAQTINTFPDLEVTDVRWSEPLEPGRLITFTAVIHNRGNAPTPANVTHGVAFLINNQVVCWSDTFRGPLAPGASRAVTSNAGPKGAGTWTAAKGDYVLKAMADDVQRIPESDDANNTQEKRLVVR